MTHRLVVGPEARAEIAEAALWYESCASGLGERFVEAVGEALKSIHDAPHQYQIIRVGGSVRRALVPRFPYALFYVILKQEVTVVACLHGRRDPRHWMRRT